MSRQARTNAKDGTSARESDVDTDTDTNTVVVVKEEQMELLEWTTDTVWIDHFERDDDGGDGRGRIVAPRTTILFVPGNPGCVGWYAEFLRTIVERAGPGFAARGVSYAGHGAGERVVGRDPEDDDDDDDERERRRRRVAHTLDGQIAHKFAWIDGVRARDGASSSLVLVGHSIGCHLIQRLCVADPALAAHVVYLTPFVVFDPPDRLSRCVLSTGARTSRAALASLDAASRFLRDVVPARALDRYMERALGLENERDRALAIALVTSPAMARNFLTLGTEELRDVPQTLDESALRIITARCSMSLLYVGSDSAPDHWAPHSHIALWKKALRRIDESSTHRRRSVSFAHMKDLSHDFVVHPRMVPPVVDFCVSQILASSSSSATAAEAKRVGPRPSSRL